MVAGFTHGSSTVILTGVITITTTTASSGVTGTADNLPPGWRHAAMIVNNHETEQAAEVPDPKLMPRIGPLRAAVRHQPKRQQLRPVPVRMARFARSAT